MFAMSASVSVALQSVNLFAPCPLHCMFAQDFVSACLDVFGGSYYLPVEIKTSCLLVHTCLFGHTSVVLFAQDSASLCTLVYMSLCVCSCIFVHTNQYLCCTKSGLFSPASVFRTQYLSAHVSVCLFAHLLVCTSACLHMHLLDCTCV